MMSWSKLMQLVIPIASYFRRRRLERFWHNFQISPHTRVLDVGGTAAIWRLLPRRPRLVILNVVPPSDRSELTEALWIIADGCQLPFRDRAFDIVFSNSVIEHVGSAERERLFAEECKRVGVRYYVQTPNKWFPIEPHLLTPIIHMLPKPMQRRLLRNFTVWGWLKRPTPEQCDRFLQRTHLLTYTEMKELFSDARIERERVFGISKSLIALRLVSPPSGA